MGQGAKISLMPSRLASARFRAGRATASLWLREWAAVAPQQIQSSNSRSPTPSLPRQARTDVS